MALITTMFLVSYPFSLPFNDLILKSNAVNLAKVQTNNSTSNSVTTLMDRANNLDRLGRYDEAMTYYNKSLAINATNIDALNGIANDLDNLKRYDEAMTYYNKVLAIDPTNVIALNGRADDLDNLKNTK